MLLTVTLSYVIEKFQISNKFQEMNDINIFDSTWQFSSLKVCIIKVNFWELYIDPQLKLGLPHNSKFKLVPVQSSLRPGQSSSLLNSALSMLYA